MNTKICSLSDRKYVKYTMLSSLSRDMYKASSQHCLVPSTGVQNCTAMALASAKSSHVYSERESKSAKSTQQTACRARGPSASDTGSYFSRVCPQLITRLVMQGDMVPGCKGYLSLKCSVFDLWHKHWQGKQERKGLEWYQEGQKLKLVCQSLNLRSVLDCRRCTALTSFMDSLLLAKWVRSRKYSPMPTSVTF